MKEIFESAANILAFGVLITTAIGVVISFYYNTKQLEANNKASNIGVSISLLQEWRDENFTLQRRRARDYLNELSQKGIVDFTELSDEKKKELDKVTHLCDEIACRVIWKEANEEMIIAFLGSALIDIWQAYEPYILHERKSKKFPLYQSYFEALVTKIKVSNQDLLIRKSIIEFIGQDEVELIALGRLHLNKNTLMNMKQVRKKAAQIGVKS
ncbi:MAG: hypothetical protein D3922_06020, partial [Candidatus Electrothrix sp. AR1]|nr:hypothetical protein [Candidatus Electrothrix sp. AR1]